MDVFIAGVEDSDKCKDGYDAIEPGTKDIEVQAVLAASLGFTAFFAFCILRPRWKSLYAARKRHLDPAVGLPPLPDSMFGWIPALYRITEDQVLSCAGLDAYVFLSFFKMAIRILLTLLFFAGAVLAPIHNRFEKSRGSRDGSDKKHHAFWQQSSRKGYGYPGYAHAFNESNPDTSFNPDMGYLWAYLVFTYFFTFLVIWFLNSETFKMIRIRQEYLGTQSTITDRTFRITGIPKELRTEGKLKDLIEKLEIGKVESVTVCRDWKELDGLVAERAAVLQKLEEAWADFRKKSPMYTPDDAMRRNNSRSMLADMNGSSPDEEEAGGENGRLLGGESAAHQFSERERPTTRIWYGFLGLRNRKTDAIDYYEEKLRRLDGRIVVARRQHYEPADIAFVTMDSIAACQMAIQALLDPRPGQLLTKLAPAPADVVWRNTYTARSSRRLSSWFVTFCVGTLSVIWLIPVAWLGTLLSLCTINEYWPSLSQWLAQHQTIKALVQTGLPTSTVSLLSVTVPFLYEWLSHKQGQLSRGDVELSIISKNFFFNFFNIFVVFSVSGTATGFWSSLQEDIHDITLLTRHVALSIEKLSNFYINFIMLQGLGLFPVRLLEFGSVFLYPFLRLLAKTPRDRAQAKQPPIFSYGFYLPTALLIFILCLVYSVLPDGYLVLILGLVYFTLGYFTYKYQLLYAMDAPRHATGGAWRIISYRVILGLLIFQAVMSGILALQTAYVCAILVLPLLVVTCWYSYYFRRRFEPLTKYISLRSIRREEHHRHGDGDGDGAASGGGGSEEAIVDGDGDDDDLESAVPPPGPSHDLVVRAGRRRRMLRRMSTVDEDRERGLRFINPSLVVPLEQPWIYDDPPPMIPEPQPSEAGSESGDPYRDESFGPELEYRHPSLVSGEGAGGNGGGLARGGGGSTSSSLSLGDTHVWRDS
ncbi:hypothetical protein GGTG_09234 [Gaeumannomyces tritici R3-111a-1]|uniref:DUF221 domain-containing protein n=1 Tax=Gaeumannomyces tritici (strain R3-111a-1) TaxID=644352 RepID=J3P6U2_GAET3|nr:hypothetical protein GGTG_09234 [Gaeumannomyces tritici R3-111a-1]EJT72368.1 hypothetical protein GGTG_09234 [Gaeumannomyces tritici R3-111a-1]